MVFCMECMFGIHSTGHNSYGLSDCGASRKEPSVNTNQHGKCKLKKSRRYEQEGHEFRNRILSVKLGMMVRLGNRKKLCI